MPEFLISFVLVAMISVFPEATVSIISAIKHAPEFGAAVLIGSNVADLAVVTGIAALASRKGIKVKSGILKKSFFCLALLFLPVLLGLDGSYSRIDGAVLVTAAALFFISLTLHKHLKNAFFKPHNHLWKSIRILALSLAVLLASAHYTIKLSTLLSNEIGIPRMIIGLTVVALGTCLPETIFSLRSVRKHHNTLALGDILGTVVTDATLILGIVALISPFSFDKTLCYVTGISMFLAGVILAAFMETGKLLTKKEGIMLIAFYLITIIVELAIKL
jgi:cation:H+ antiporter